MKEHHKAAIRAVRDQAQAVINSGIAGAASEHARKDFLLADALLHLLEGVADTVKAAKKAAPKPKPKPPVIPPSKETEAK